MNGTDMELRLLEDVIAGGGTVDLPDDGVNRICYVVHGEVSIGSAVLRDDQALHVKGSSRLAAAPCGATVWRFELAPADAPLVAFSRPSGSTSEKLTQRLQWPVADQILIRNDSVSFPPGGCAFLHTHQGPGIRCLIEGGIRIDTSGAFDQLWPRRRMVRGRPRAGVRAGCRRPSHPLHPGDGPAGAAQGAKFDRLRQSRGSGEAEVAELQGICRSADRVLRRAIACSGGMIRKVRRASISDAR